MECLRQEAPDVWKCGVCGATVCRGEVHRADRPEPHISILPLLVWEALARPRAHEATPDDCFAMRHFAGDLR
jgi:hypothetical protein